MTSEEFKKYGYQLVDWVAEYQSTIRQYPVRSQVKPKEIYNALPDNAPEKGESMDLILEDFNNLLVKGITHWQHPNFHAYFPANTSWPSILGEILMAGIGAQCMLWETSPAAAELEEKVVEWLKKAMSLPMYWQGVIQDTASTATLAALLTAREVKTNFSINQRGFSGQIFRIYASEETHSSIEKGVKIAGFGQQNLIKIKVDADRSMSPIFLKQAIEADLKQGYIPLAVVTTLGSTSTLAQDDFEEIGKICQNYGLWHHLDAAYAGTALLLPEFRKSIGGLETVDSFVFNPHKWMLTNFDCTLYYIRDKESLLRTFEIWPEYLKTPIRGLVNDYRDWGIPLGRRFRSLKLWMVLRHYGLEGIRQKLLEHIELTQWLEMEMRQHSSFELVVPRRLNLLVFRLHPNNYLGDLNTLNAHYLKSLNDSGELYLTQTKINDLYCIRLVIGQTNVNKKDIETSWAALKKYAQIVF